jgi:pyruvate dehydrogenase E2 component (dihydrolipoamide acetyltransferase)
VPVNSVVAYIGEAGEQIPDAPSASEPSAPPQAEPPESQAAMAPERAPVQELAPAPVASQGQRLRISPRASRMAAEAGLDPRTLSGTGPDGRIVERDVQVAIAADEQPAPPRPEPASAAVSPADGEEPPRPLSRMRRVIAERMTLSATQIPQFQVTVAVDATRLVQLRERLKTEGSALTLTDFVMVAAAQSLVAMPIVNARTDGQQVWLRRRVHLGLAVAVPNGLVVIVVRDADDLTIDEVHDRAAAMASAAREGKLSPDDMAGSTFSISNLGMHGVEQFTAIINPGESAVLAVSSATRTPVAVGGGIGIATIMRLTLSADHRLIDGETAARFLDDLRRRLERPEELRSSKPPF